MVNSVQQLGPRTEFNATMRKQAGLLGTAGDGWDVDWAAAAFGRLAFTHRKEHARWIDEAKRPETRQRRTDQAVQMIRDRKTRS